MTSLRYSELVDLAQTLPLKDAHSFVAEALLIYRDTNPDRAKPLSGADVVDELEELV